MNVSNTIYYQGQLLDPLLSGKVVDLEDEVVAMKGTGWTTANTIKGKGVDFMENNVAWHYKSPNDEELYYAIRNLESEREINLLKL